MDGDQKNQARGVVAHLFQRSGQGALSESEMTNALSLDLGWFAPKDARRLVAGLVRAGFLQHTEDGDLEPVFDVQGERVPLGFRPGPGLASALPPPGAGGAAAKTTEAGQQTPTTREQAEETPPARTAPATEGDGVELSSLLETFAAASGEEMGVWVQRMERVAQETGDLLVPEVALLLAASREGRDVGLEAASWRKRLEAKTES